MAIHKPITDEEIAAGQARGQERAKREPRALSVAYDADRDRIELELDTGFALAIPRSELEGLADATPEQLANVQILGPGVAIAWDDPDVGFTVDGLWNQLYGTKSWMSELGRRTSERKAAAARANGAKGGRPKKVNEGDAIESHRASSDEYVISVTHRVASGSTFHRAPESFKLKRPLFTEGAFTVTKRRSQNREPHE
jgi:hypothetical protein